MLDRMSELVPRLAACAEGADSAALASLADIRVGINIVDLQHAASGAPPPQRAAIQAVLRGVSTYFAASRFDPPSPSLLAAIDTALELCGAPDVPNHREIRLALAGMRRALFRAAPGYTPTPMPPPALELAA
jgi:hypothetical protein